MTSNYLRVLCGSALLGSMAAMSSPALAANDAMLELIEIMHNKGSITQEEYSLLKNAARADAEKNEAIKQEVKDEVAEVTRDMPKITTKEKLKVESRDGNFAWGIGGRIQADAAFYDNDDAVTDNNTDFESGHELRRARLEMDGKLWQVWGFKIQYDFADTSLKDAFINYTGFGNTKLQVGHFKEPFSLEELTSSKYITFQERSLPNAFAPGRALGAAVYSHFSDMFTAAAGVFGDAVDSTSANGTGVASGYGITGRLTFSPVHEEGRIVHFGGAVSHRSPSDTDTLRFRERMESHVTDTRIVDTGAFGGVDDYTRYGFEAAGVYDRFSLQGEYIMTDINRQTGFGGDIDFDGYYIYGSVFLTDDSRAYKFEDGAFDKVSPKSVVGKGGIGAWELGVRFSSINLDDGPIAGGEVDNMTLGLNWYATRNVRFIANYTTVLDSNTSSGPFPGAEPAVFQTRAQVFW